MFESFHKKKPEQATYYRMRSPTHNQYASMRWTARDKKAKLRGEISGVIIGIYREYRDNGKENGNYYNRVIMY